MTGAIAGTAILYANNMAGAIAGSAILHSRGETKGLHTVTLTVNNVCNLSCPHCYLQYDGPREELSESDASKVLEADFKHLAIVGKEPTLSPKIVENLVRFNEQKGRKTSVITNGHHLLDLSDDTLQGLDYIDVSLDGGPKSYESRRKMPYKEILKMLRQAFERVEGQIDINALHTLYRENIRDIDDMMQVEENFLFERIAFSPYKIPQNDGQVFVHKSSMIDEVLPALVENERFMRSDKSVLLVSQYDAAPLSSEKFLERVSRLGLEKKIYYVEDPLIQGFIRVNYDGKVLTPHDAIHPSLYHLASHSLHDPGFKGLNEIFDKMREERRVEVKVCANQT